MRFLVLFALACGPRHAPTREPIESSLDTAAPTTAAATTHTIVPTADASEMPPTPPQHAPNRPGDDPVHSAPMSADLPSPPVIVGRVVGIEPEPTGSIVTVGIGKDKGIAKHWRAALLGEDKKRVETLQILSVSQRTCRLRSKQTADFVRSHPLVAFEP